MDAAIVAYFTDGLPLVTCSDSARGAYRDAGLTVGVGAAYRVCSIRRRSSVCPSSWPTSPAADGVCVCPLPVRRIV